MSKARVPLLAFILLLGIALFVYGGYDDSPGAQLLGALVALSCAIGLLRNRRK